MNVIVEKIASSVRLQDLFLVVICCLSVYLLRSRDQFVLQPSWRQDSDPGGGGGGAQARRSLFPDDDRQRLPGPVITDLDGDEVVEVVVVTPGLRLSVCVVPVQNATEVRLPELTVVRSVRLPSPVPADGLRSGPRLVALETGYLAAPTSEKTPRTQVIVVVLSDWTVICYTSDLTLLWSRKLLNVDESSGHYFVKSMGILVAPHSLQKGDRGCVIVGGSFGHRNHDARRKSLRADGVSDSVPDRNDSTQISDSLYTHFSTFALSGNDGSIRWRHIPGDFEQKTSDDFDSSKLHWKLALNRGNWHTGEVHWSKYSGNIIKHMPHSWKNIRDTKFDLSDLRKAPVVSSRVESMPVLKPLAPLKDIIDFEGEHLIGIQYGGMQPHSRHEHVAHPSAVIIHNDEGVEVLDIDTGRPLTHLDLRSGGRPVTFVDVNEDNTIEEVAANFNLKCQAEVSTIQPRPKAIFAGPLCESPFWWGGVSLRNLFYTPEVVSEDTHMAVAPVVVKSIARSRGMFAHLLGKALPSERKGYDSIFLTSTGRLSSYSPAGQPNWQLMIPVSWSALSFKAETDSSFAATQDGKIFFSSFQPTMIPLSLQLYAKQTAVLVSGWDSVALVDLREGYVLGHHSLPCQPIHAPILQDFNGDGWMDFVVTCRDAYIGFEIHKASSITYSVIIAIAVVLGVMLLVWCCQQHPDD